MRSDWTVLEVGAAPGHNLVDLHRTFGYQPFGVEYSPVGVQQTRDTFRQIGLNPDNIIEADFFNPEFQARNAERFDVVLSSGFIEHFDDPTSVVRHHLNLLRPNGYLLCTVPNLHNYAYPYQALLGRDLLRVHNGRIMSLKPYRTLFDPLALETVLCTAFGVCQMFGLPGRLENSARGRVARFVDRASTLLDSLLFLILRGRAPETRWSPHLLYLGRKKTLSNSQGE